MAGVRCRMIKLLPASDYIELSLSLLNGDTRFQPGNPAHPCPGALRIVILGSKRKVNLIRAAHQTCGQRLELRRHDSNHGIRLAVELQGPSDQSRILAKSPLP